jgi:glutathione synthase/RimK-type ligase-like ATP-grasp enzyme
MLVGIHTGKYGKWPLEFKVYEDILDYNNIDYVRLDVNDPDFWETVKKLDLFLYVFHNTTDMKELARTIMPVIEKYMNIKCFPDQASSWFYDDKIKEYYLLKENGFPVINTQIFWNKNEALKWVETADFPKVFKLKAGSQSSNVVFVNNKNTASKLVKKMFYKGIDPNKVPFNKMKLIKDFTIKKWFKNSCILIYRWLNGIDLYPYWDRQKNYIIFQDFQPGNNYDTRITVIGNRAFGLIRHNRKNDFRASGSGKKDYDTSNIDMRFVEIAFRVSEKLNVQSMAYDFLYDRNKEPVICEISYKYPLRGIYLAPGYWDRDLVWHPGHYWPQYLHLMDALNRPDLKQPEIQPWEDETLKEQIFKKFRKRS